MGLVRELLRIPSVAFRYWTVRTAPRKTVDRIVLSCSSVLADCVVFFDKCRTGIDLIRTFDRRRFERLRCYVDTVALTSGGASFYEPRLRTMFLDLDVLKREPPYIAATIVHEMTHARLRRLRVRNYDLERNRHERLCIREEIDFASRLPNSEALVRALRRNLDEQPWDEAGRRRQIRRFVERHNLPDWLERFLVRFGAR